ncbi:hypothetical protein B0H10DRAFT_2233846 [Mycena sp. CBHHK59/15]|nr:hypothetical protein B0H10DRAFT_2233846 [Mycena sp. CBHHK59/15]
MPRSKSAYPGVLFDAATIASSPDVAHFRRLRLKDFLLSLEQVFGKVQSTLCGSSDVSYNVGDKLLHSVPLPSRSHLIGNVHDRSDHRLNEVTSQQTPIGCRRSRINNVLKNKDGEVIITDLEEPSDIIKLCEALVAIVPDANMKVTLPMLGP